MSSTPDDGPATLAARVSASLGSGDPRRSLRHDSLRFVRTVALSVGIQGPTAGVIVGPAVMAGIVGGSGALAYLLGFVAMAFCAYAFVIFTRSFNSASSVDAFNGAALGWALTMVLAYTSIRVSSLVVFLLVEGVAIGLISIVGVVILAGGGYHGHAFSSAPFALHGVALGVLGLGVVNAFGGFSGFEGAVVLGEEARSSTRTIPARSSLRWLSSPSCTSRSRGSSTTRMRPRRRSPPTPRRSCTSPTAVWAL